MKIRILGCGPSYGVPSLSRGYGACDPENPKNYWLRSAVLLQEKGHTLLIDSGPEIRIQLLKAGCPKLDAVLYTHEHYDHMGGADDLRSDLAQNGKILPVYLSESAVRHFENILDYLFRPNTKNCEAFELNIIKPYQSFDIGPFHILPIPQKHGDGISMGFRINDIAYSTDVVEMEEKAFDVLKGIKVWILGVTTPVPNNKHINVETALKWIEKVQPKRAYFTHMGSRMDYEKLCATLPEFIRPVYDEMEIKA